MSTANVDIGAGAACERLLKTSASAAQSLDKGAISMKFATAEWLVDSTSAALSQAWQLVASA